jgi:hypothetical protein
MGNKGIILSLYKLSLVLNFLHLYMNVSFWRTCIVIFEGFPRLKKLEMLDLTYNYLNSSILPSLNGLHALKTLKLGSNLMNYFSAQGTFSFYNLFMGK